MFTTVNEFNQWLNNELDKRNWSASDLARAAGVGRSSISMVLNQNRGIGPELCLAIARALKYPPKVVFEAAGLLPPEPDIDAGFEEWAYMLSQLPERDRDELLQIARLKLERQEKEEQERLANKKKGAGKDIPNGADLR